jgi:hypothetical protein
MEVGLPLESFVHIYLGIGILTFSTEFHYIGIGGVSPRISCFLILFLHRLSWLTLIEIDETDCHFSEKKKAIGAAHRYSEKV